MKIKIGMNTIKNLQLFFKHSFSYSEVENE